MPFSTIKPKPCKYCKSLLHTSLACFDKPRRTLGSPFKPRRNYGNARVNDHNTRKRWLFHNQSTDGYYSCHYCGKPLTVDRDKLDMGIELLTLDHIKTRSERPDLRYDIANLVTCCEGDNTLRGSMKYEMFCQQYYPNLVESKTEGAS